MARGPRTKSAPNFHPTRPDRRGIKKRAGFCHAAVQSLETRVLLTSNGVTGEYFSSLPAADGTFVNFNKTRDDTGAAGQAINFTFNATTLPAGVSANSFAARWEGVIAVPSSVTATANFTFVATVVGDETLWINDQKIIDGATVGFHHSGSDTSAIVTLNSGATASIRMDYISDSTKVGQGTTATPSVQLSWSAVNAKLGTSFFTNTPVLYTDVTNLKNPIAYTAPGNGITPVTTTPSGMKLGNWSYDSIGNPVAGDTASSSGSGSATTYQVTAVGKDANNKNLGIGYASSQGTDDSFEYLYQTVTGDFTLTARVTGISGPVTNGPTDTPPGDDGFLGGLMVRSSLSSASPFVAIGDKIDDSIWGPTRQYDKQPTSSSSRITNAQTGYSYLKITRVGDAVAGYWSVDGVTWQVGKNQQLYNAPETLVVGMMSSATTSSSGTVAFSNVSLTGAASNNNTSFLGNSFGDGGLHVPGTAGAAYVDPASGNLYLSSRDEDQGLWTLNAAGTITGSGTGTHFDGGGVPDTNTAHTPHVSDGAVTADPAMPYSFIAQAGGTGDYGVQRVSVLGDNAGEEMQSDIVTGLAFANGKLYVASNNMVYEYLDTASTLSFTGNAFEADGAAQMAADNSGNLWIVQTVAGNNAATRIENVNVAAGANFGVANSAATITFPTANYAGYTVIPHGIAVNPINGFLYVTDTSALQQIHVYDASGIRQTDFGDIYGVYGGSPVNVAGATKFDYPVGIGFDSAGDAYVVNGGAPQQASELNLVNTADIIRKFTPNQKLLWERDAAMYQDVGNPDPANPNAAYVGGYNYNLNYNSTDPGGEQSMQGPLIEKPFLYKTDPRLIRTNEFDGTGPAVSGGTGGIVRTIGATKYLFELNDSSAMIYRFDPSNPNATIFYGELLSNDNLSRFYTWFDKLDGTGTVGVKDAGEENTSAAAHLHGQFGISVDESGDLWFADKTSATIWEYQPVAVPNSNVISYPLASARQWSAPDFTYSSSIGRELDRVVYSVTTQTLYVTGYVSNAPSYGLVGDTLEIYNKFNPNTAATLGTVSHKVTIAGGIGGPYSALTVDKSGQYVFIASRNPPSGVFILNGNTGALIANLLPGPQPGASTNAVDIRDGINATLIPSGPAAGQYFINVEQVQEARSTTFRWTPNQVSQSVPQTGWTDLDIGSPALVGQAQDNLNGAWEVQGGGTDIYQTVEQFNYASTIVTGDQQIIAHIPILTGPNAWTKVGVMMRAGTGSNYPVYAAIFETFSNGLQFQYSMGGQGNVLKGTSANVSGDANSVWVKMVRTGDTISGYYTTTDPPSTWTPFNTISGFNAGGLGASYNVGLAVNSHDSGHLADVKFGGVSVSAPLINSMIGTATYSLITYDDANKTYQATGSATGVTQTADNIAFASTVTNSGGVGSIIARLDYVSYTNPQATFGLMYRDPGAINPAEAANVCIKIKPASGLQVSFRSNSDTPGANASTPVVGMTPNINPMVGGNPAGGICGPVWLELTRNGTSFTASYSTDGANWIRVATLSNVNMSNNAAAGLVTTSGDSSTAFAKWNDVSVN